MSVKEIDDYNAEYFETMEEYNDVLSSLDIDVEELDITDQLY